MSNDSSVIPPRLTADMVRTYVDFDGRVSVPDAVQSRQAKLQSEGVAALWHLLQQKGYAYLADEVGMGKTRQAMAIIATQFLKKHDSRVVIVCPGEALQRQWQTEWSGFLRSCYRLADDRLLGADDLRQLESLHLHQNVGEFVKALRLGDARIHLMRYSSFSRPLSFKSDEPSAILEEYLCLVGADSFESLTPAEQAIAKACESGTQSIPSDLTQALSLMYCRRIGELMTDGTSRNGESDSRPNDPIDLVIFDEAQYLRHTDNFRNRHIAAAFRRNVDRWLFLSATPLHSSAGDLASLDTYVCRRQLDVSTRIPEDCEGCEHASRCTRVAYQLGKRGDKKMDVVDLLPTMMVRRKRTYVDKRLTQYGKLEYRAYRRIRHSGADDPFLSMTMALVQKRLVGILAGQQNRFRMGECASFESLSTSVGRVIERERRKQKNGVALKEFEGRQDGKRQEKNDEPNLAIDRTAIDELSRSFVSRMNALSKGDAKTALVDALPHAKLSQTVERLFESSLADGSSTKTLVFVRRIDTVEELRDQLHAKFQRHVDERIDTWRDILERSGWMNGVIEQNGAFWAVDTDSDEPEEEPGEQGRPPESSDEADDEPPPPVHISQFRVELRLPYFEALKRAPEGSGGPHGKLVSFASRLRSAKEPSQKPLRGFLLRRPAPSGSDLTDGSEALWSKNAARWARFLKIVMGESRLAELRADKAYGWLFVDPAASTPDAWKVASLQRCILQSMRQTDFIVDLYILHTHATGIPDAAELPEKLLWFLEQEYSAEFAGLSTYIGNWKRKFKDWIECFDLIVEKCFSRNAVVDWQRICQEDIDREFRLMAPVTGRSSRLRAHSAIVQFKLPVHPNILICTDVLKEGVDMHLFCDRVDHYGVAWTPGDLEQRIGRVDRLASLVARKLANYDSSKHDGTIVPPKLGVAFPYLDGTLDRHQVARVLREKLASDLKMDLAKRNDEIAELDISSLEFDEGATDTPVNLNLPASLSGPADRDGIVFFPEDANFVFEEGVPASPRLTGNMRYRQPDEVARLSGPSESSGTAVFEYLASLGCTRVRMSLDPISMQGGLAARRILATGEGVLRLSKAYVQDAGSICTEEVLLLGEAHECVSLADALDLGGSVSVRSASHAAFAFDKDVNTTTYQPVTPQVMPIASRMGGKVLLESIGEVFWLLRAQVCSTGALCPTGDRRVLIRWLAAQNRPRRWGYLMEDRGNIWFAAVVKKADGDEWDLLERLARSCARIGDYYHGLVPAASDHVALAYKSHVAFPSLKKRCGEAAFRLVAPARFDAVEGKEILNMKHDDLIECGRVLAGVGAWFTEAFRHMLGALYEGMDVDPDETALGVTPLEFLDGGVLHLSSNQPEHFRLQAYLDLNGVLTSDAVIPGPKMIWELVASPTRKGPKPRLEGSKLEELPHAYWDAWVGEVVDGCCAFTSRGEKYRYIALYHAPSVWDSARGELVAAMQDVRNKMQDLTNFTEKRLRDSLIEAASTPTRGYR